MQYFYLRAFLSIIRKCTDLKELTPELVNGLITKIEIFDSTKDENGKKHVPIKVHFIGVGILEIPDTQTIIAAQESAKCGVKEKYGVALIGYTVSTYPDCP